MLFRGKTLGQIDQNDLLQLIEDEMSESKTLDFKRELHLDSSEQKKEFLKDLSAFANASGGFIIYGMDEDEGRASELVGLVVEDIDKQILRMDSIAQSGIDPRISVEFKPINLESDRFAIIASIPKSWTSPHAVDHGKHWRFYSRNSAGNYPLDVDEVRNIIIASETLRERIRNFKAERLGNVIADETPIPLDAGAKVVLTTIPLTAFDNFNQIPFRKIDNGEIREKIGHRWRYNVDGYLGYRTGDQPSYTQVFRNGIIEYLDSWLSKPEDAREVNANTLEKTLMEVVDTSFLIYETCGIKPPIIVFLSLVGFKGYHLHVNIRRPTHYPIDRDVLNIPEIEIRDFSEGIHTILRPMFDMVWNAFGYPESLHYDQNGNRRYLGQ